MPTSIRSTSSSEFIQKLITDSLAEGAAQAAGGQAVTGEGGTEAGGAGATGHGGVALAALLKSEMGATGAVGAQTGQAGQADVLGTGGGDGASLGAAMGKGETSDDMAAVAKLSQQVATDAGAESLATSISTIATDVSTGLPSDTTLSRDINDFAGEMHQQGLDQRTATSLRDLVDNGTLDQSELSHVYTVAEQLGIDIDTSSAPLDATAAASQLQSDLQANPTPSLPVIMLDTAHYARALRGQQASSTDVANNLSAIANQSNASSAGSAAALVAAMMLGYTGGDSDTSNQVAQSTSKTSRAAIGRTGAKQAASERQASMASANASGNAAGSSSTNTANTSTDSAGAIEAPEGAVGGDGITGYGTQIPWSDWHQQGYAAGTFNNEQETYTTDGSNVSFDSDNNLVITAKPQADGSWTSARLEGPKVTQLPEYIEAVIKTPSGQGTWPAFWSTGPNWPTTGEVDTMEQVNGGNQNISTHIGNSATDKTDTHQEVSLSNMSDTFHRYGVLYTSTGVQFYLDGKAVGDPVNMGANWAQNALQQQLVLNLAMGGDWPGNAPTSTGEQQMVVKGVYTSSEPPSS